MVCGVGFSGETVRKCLFSSYCGSLLFVPYLPIDYSFYLRYQAWWFQKCPTRVQGSQAEVD
jgi:hypothetical protein